MEFILVQLLLLRSHFQKGQVLISVIFPDLSSPASMTKPQPSNMVRFAPTTSILPNNTEENATSNRNFAVEEDESEKERFPVTPHPFKERAQNENLLSSDNTYDCVSQVSSVSIDVRLIGKID